MKLPENEATSTRGVPPFVTDEKAVNDYYPFGMTIADRSWQSTDYRYGYNMQEKSTEIDPNGNHNTAEFWEYDTRSGRRWNTDPVVKPWESSYATFALNPIFFNDINGLTAGGIKDESCDKKPNQNYNTSPNPNITPNIEGRNFYVSPIKPDIESTPPPATEQKPAPTPPASNAEAKQKGKKIDVMETIETYIGLVSIPLSTVENLGGLDKAKNLIESGKFEIVYKGKTKQWKLAFHGNKHVDATLVKLAKTAYLSKAVRASQILTGVTVVGKVLNGAGLLITAVDIYNNKLTPKNTADATFGLYGLIPGYGWGVSAIYFGIGETIGWDNAIKSYIKTQQDFYESTGERFQPLGPKW